MSSAGIHTLIQAADFLDKRPRTRAFSRHPRVSSRGVTKHSSPDRPKPGKFKLSKQKAQVKSRIAAREKSESNEAENTEIPKKRGRNNKNTEQTQLLQVPEREKSKRKKHAPQWIQEVEIKEERDDETSLKRRKGRPRSSDIESPKPSKSKKKKRGSEAIYFSPTAESSGDLNENESPGSSKEKKIRGKSSEEETGTLSKEELDTIEKMIYDQIVDVQHVEEIQTTDMKIPHISSPGGISNFTLCGTTRDAHNVLEKNRRAQIKQLFEMLKSKLPVVDERISNLKLLQLAVRQVQLLREKDHELLKMKIELISRKRFLSNWLSELSSTLDQSKELKGEVLDGVNDLLQLVEEDEKEMLLHHMPQTDRLDGGDTVAESSSSLIDKRRRRRGPAVKKEGEDDSPDTVDISITTGKKSKSYGFIPGKPFVQHIALPSHALRRSVPVVGSSTGKGPVTPPPLILLPEFSNTIRPAGTRTPVILSKSSPSSSPIKTIMRPVLKPLVTTNKLQMPNGRIINAQIHRPSVPPAAPAAPRSQQSSAITHMFLSNGKLVDVSDIMKTSEAPSPSNVAQVIISSGNGKTTPNVQLSTDKEQKKSKAAFDLPDTAKMSPTLQKYIELSKCKTLPRTMASKSLIKSPAKGTSTSKSRENNESVKEESQSNILPVTDLGSLLGGSSSGGVVEINNVKYLAVPLSNTTTFQSTGSNGENISHANDKSKTSTPMFAQISSGRTQITPITLTSAGKLLPVVLDTVSKSSSSSNMTTLPVVNMSSTAQFYVSKAGVNMSTATLTPVSLISSTGKHSLNFTPVKMNTATVTTASK